ncbi:MAG: YdcF family protein [Verrucomicrobiales bacterium]|nr:YdcF family protein [Verrucomicrobiales bacterium]
MKKILSRFLPFLLALLFVILLVAMSGSGLIAKKVIGHLILPSGFLWLVGLTAMFWPGVKRPVRGVLIGVWLLYSFAGSPYVGVALLRVLEEPYYRFEQPAEKLDALVLLGGGTGLSPGGQPALGTHGDRLLTPATLYYKGLVGTLITTGRSITEEGGDRFLSRETAQIWQGLGVPAAAIIEVPEPRNTSEEIAAVAALMKKHPEWKTVGLSSSASHLSRALKESRAQGLALVPVPSDFRSTPLIFSPLYLVPQGRGFRDVQTALWEWMGSVL